MKFSSLFLIFSLVIISITSSICFSQDEPKRPVILDTVVVTAQKAKTPVATGDVDMESTPVFTSVIRREAFEGKTESLANIIEKETGVQVRQSGGLGSFSSVSLRGATSDQVMVYLDGILLNDASGGGVDLSNISLSDVESIEIYKGMTPVNFGKASVGGAVNIRTLRSKEGFGGNAIVGFGSFNTIKAGAMISQRISDFDYLISADYLTADNDYEILNDNGTQYNPDDDRWEDRNNADVDRFNLLARFGYQFSKDRRLDFLNQFFSKDQGLPTWNNSPAASTTFDVDRNISTLSFTANDFTPLHFNTKTQAHYTWKQEEYDDSKGQVGLGRQHNTYKTNRLGFNTFWEWLGEINTVTALMDFLYEKYDMEDHLGTQNPRDSRRYFFNLGAQDNLYLFDDTLIITPAGRITWIDDKLESAMSVWGVPLEGRSRNDFYFTPQLGIRYIPYNWLTLKTNIARYVREPSFFELFGDRGFFMGNPDLKEEEGINFDMGFEINRIFTKGWLRRISVNCAYFRTDADDLITRVYDARGVGKSVNISGALIQGIEFGASVEIFDYIRAVFNATYQDTENQSDIKAFDGKSLPGRFDQTYLARLEGVYKKIKIYVEYIREADMYYDTANLRKARNRNEVNAGISWNFKSFLVSFEGKNLGDELYEDFNGYPLPGRSFYCSVKYEF